MKKAILVALVAMVASSASAALLLYEGFDYDSEVKPAQLGLAGKNGGTGWSGAWALAKRDATINGGSLSYGSLTTTGNSVYVDQAYNGSTGWGGTDPHNWDELTRGNGASFSSADGNSYWISYLVQLTTTATPAFGKWLGIKFTSGGDLWAGINGSQDNWGLETPGGTQTSIPVNTSTHLLVMKVEYTGGVENKYLWVDPSTSSLNGSDLATGTANASGLNQAKSAFGGIVLTGVRDSYVDEIRVATTYADVTPIPEPASILLLAGGIVGAYKLRRRK